MNDFFTNEVHENIYLWPVSLAALLFLIIWNRKRIKQFFCMHRNETEYYTLEGEYKCEKCGAMYKGRKAK